MDRATRKQKVLELVKLFDELNIVDLARLDLSEGWYSLEPQQMAMRAIEIRALESIEAFLQALKTEVDEPTVIIDGQ